MPNSHTFFIPRWHPATVNQLLRGVRQATRLKKRDRSIIWGYATQEKIPKANGKRLLTLTIILRPRARGADVDAYHKSCLDGMKHAALIVDDSPKWLEIAPVKYERGTMVQWGTIIDLQDIA